MFSPDITSVLPGELFDEVCDPCNLHDDPDALLMADPEFSEICDSRRDEMISRMEEEFFYQG